MVAMESCLYTKTPRPCSIFTFICTRLCRAFNLLKHWLGTYLRSGILGDAQFTRSVKEGCVTRPRRYLGSSRPLAHDHCHSPQRKVLVGISIAYMCPPRPLPWPYLKFRALWTVPRCAHYIQSTRLKISENAGTQNRMFFTGSHCFLQPYQAQPGMDRRRRSYSKLRSSH